MNYNPYAAPQAPQPQQPQIAGGGAPQPWEVGEVYGQAWEIFKSQWAVLVFSWVLVLFLIGGPSQVARFSLAPTPLGRIPRADELIAMYTGALLPIYLVAFAAQSFLEVGLIRIQCAAARGETPNFALLFSGGSKFLPILAVKLLLAFMIGMGTLFLVVPGVILFLALWPVEYFIIEANQDIGTAFKSAWSATQNQWLALFLFFLLGFALYVGGFVACCLGWLATYPLYRVAKAIVFQRISGMGGAMIPALSPYAQPAGGYPPPGGGGYGGPPPGGGYGPPPGGGGYGPPPGGGGGYGPPPGGGGGFPPPGGGYGPPR